MGIQEMGEKPALAAAAFALLPGLVCAVAMGLALGALGQAPGVDAAGMPLHAGFSLDPVGLLLGLALGWGAGFLAALLSGSLLLHGAVQAAHQRLHQAGLALPKAAARWTRPGEVAESLQQLAEHSAQQVVTSRKEMGKYKEALGRYADPNLARSVSQESNLSKLGVRKVRMAVLFCDIRGFTKMSEALKVDDVVSVLNGYFALGAKAVGDNNGQINKFIGDAILAVFLDPPGLGSGMTCSRNAVSAGLAIINAFRVQSRVWHEGIETPFEAGVGVGIHYGEVIQGTMGSPERLEYTVIGDTVNFASRLCSLAKSGQLRVSEELYKNVDDQVEAEEMDPVSVKGKSGEYKTFQVLGKKPGAL